MFRVFLAVVLVITPAMGYDLDGDGRVGLGDCAVLASHFTYAPWGHEYQPRFDFNGDGAVNGADMCLLMAHCSERPCR